MILALGACRKEIRGSEKVGGFLRRQSRNRRISTAKKAKELLGDLE